VNCIAQIFVPFFLGSVALAATCIPFDQAQNHIGETECITGRVIRIAMGARGTHYLDFCEDYRLCSFSVVVFHTT
jgi:hypothetical protein